MVEIEFGQTIRATCRYDYDGPAGYFNFVQEIGTIIVGPPFPDYMWNFNTLNRWEDLIYVTPGRGKTLVMEFAIIRVDGLNPGDTYDMNYEISQGGRLLARKFTDDIIKIKEEAAPPGEGEFRNLSVSYSKA